MNRILFSMIILIFSGNGTSQASTINLEFLNSFNHASTVGSKSISVSTKDFTVTTQGYVSEISGFTDTVHGPFEAHDFRTCTNTNACGAVSTFGLHYYNGGFGLLAGDTASVDVSGTDRSGGGVAPGFNGYYRHLQSPGLLISQFASFNFDNAVDIGGVIVDDVSNFGRNAWIAYSDTTPDFSSGLAGALASMTLVNSYDDAGDGLFTHNLGASNVKTLLVGSLISGGSYSGIAQGSSQFYIRGFEEIGLTLNSGGGVTPIPLPTGFPLLAGALGLLGLVRVRSNKTSSV